MINTLVIAIAKVRKWRISEVLIVALGSRLQLQSGLWRVGRHRGRGCSSARRLQRDAPAGLAFSPLIVTAIRAALPGFSRRWSPGEFYLAVFTAAAVVAIGVEQGILLRSHRRFLGTSATAIARTRWCWSRM
jgi:hypothetical protein